jgi:hypothetical protein
LGSEWGKATGSGLLDFRRYGNLIIIIIFINCKWVDTRWQWLFYMYTECDIDYY